MKKTLRVRLLQEQERLSQKNDKNRVKWLSRSFKNLKNWMLKMRKTLKAIEKLSQIFSGRISS